MLEEWFAARPEELVPFLARVLARDGSGRRHERVLAETLGAATRETKQRFFDWVEDRTATDDQALLYAEVTFAWMRREIEAHRGPLAGLRILELGPVTRSRWASSSTPTARRATRGPTTTRLRARPRRSTGACARTSSDP